MGIRFLVNNSLGFASINKFEKKKISQIVLQAIKRVKRARNMNANVRLSEESVNKKNYKVTQKINLKDIDPDKKMKLLHDIDEKSIQTPPKIGAGNKSKYLKGMVKFNEEIAIVLDINKILISKEIIRMDSINAS